MHIAVALLRISEGLDCSIGDVEEQKKSVQTIPGNQSFSQLSQGLQYLIQYLILKIFFINIEFFFTFSLINFLIIFFNHIFLINIYFYSQ